MITVLLASLAGVALAVPCGVKDYHGQYTGKQVLCVGLCVYVVHACVCVCVRARRSVARTVFAVVLLLSRGRVGRTNCDIVVCLCARSVSHDGERSSAQRSVRVERSAHLQRDRGGQRCAATESLRLALQLSARCARSFVCVCAFVCALVCVYVCVRALVCACVCSFNVVSALVCKTFFGFCHVSRPNSL